MVTKQTEEKPNLRFALQVPSELTRGNGWTWSDVVGCDHIGEDYATSAGDVAAALRVWGKVAAQLIIGASFDRFVICAYSTITGHILGRDTWSRSAETGRLIPHGEPFCVWEGASRL